MAHIFPLHLQVASFAGLMNRRQAVLLEYLIEENRILKEQLKEKRLRLTDDQRRRLAAKGKRIGSEVTPAVDHSQVDVQPRGVGRPGLMREIREQIVRFAMENSGWGYCRIEGALRNVGHRVSPSTIRNVPKQHGIKPAPNRHSSWRTYLESPCGPNTRTSCDPRQTGF